MCKIDVRGVEYLGDSIVCVRNCKTAGGGIRNEGDLQGGTLHEGLWRWSMVENLLSRMCLQAMVTL